jgi:hypothetical protein
MGPRFQNTSDKWENSIRYELVANSQRWRAHEDQDQAHLIFTSPFQHFNYQGTPGAFQVFLLITVNHQMPGEATAVITLMPGVQLGSAAVSELK